MIKTCLKHKIQLRSANNNDIDQIYNLLTFYAKDELLLKLSKSDIRKRIDTFIIANNDSDVAGCAGIRDFGNNLYEIRSLAVKYTYSGLGIGSKMVKYLINQISSENTINIFALTYRATFFERLGFQHVDKELFPQKIWSDCSKCPKQNNCDEEALMLTLNHNE